jgi:putative thiamine transport system ATP-binding protein
MNVCKIGVTITNGLVLDQLRVCLGTRVLFELSATVSPGEVLTVMGASGSGKSSLLSCIAGTLSTAFTAQGKLLLEGVPLLGLPPERRGVGLLFQDDLLFPHLSVGGNLAFAIPRDIHSKHDRRRLIEDALVDCGLNGFADRDPATLSGGQRARISVMRVLLSRPRALLLDEPFSKLDHALRGQFRTFVFREAQRRALPIVLVTHDPADAEAAGNNVITLSEEQLIIDIE